MHINKAMRLVGAAAVLTFGGALGGARPARADPPLVTLNPLPVRLLGSALPVAPLIRPPVMPFIGGGPIYSSRPTGIAMIVLGVGLAAGLGIAGTPPICAQKPSESRCEGMMGAGYGLGGVLVIFGIVLVTLPD